MDEERESGCTLRDLGRMIGKRIWWILGISVLIAVLAALLTAFVFNRGKDTYSVSFMIEFPGGEETYPDGTPLRYESIVYAENLQSVKTGDASFSDLDIGRMTSASDGIRISERSVEGTQADTRVYTGIYEITVGSGYFESVEQATRFLRGVAQQVIENVNAKFSAIDLTAWETAYDSAISYSARVSSVRSQYDDLLARYDAYLTTDAYASFASEGRTLRSLRNELQETLGTRISGLETMLANNRYILSDAELNSVLRNIEQLELEQTGNTRRIGALEAELERLYAIYGDGMTSGQMDTFETFHDAIRVLTDRNAEISYEIERLYTAAGYTQRDGKWTPGDGVLENAAFTEELDAVHALLVSQTSVCKEALTGLFESQSYIDFEQSGIVTADGGINPVLAAVVGFVIAFLAAGLIFCAVDYPAYKKRQLAALSAQEPSEALPKAQAGQKD